MRYFVLFFFFISTNNIYASSISIGGSHGVDVSSKSTEFEFDLEYIADSKFHEHDIEFDYDVGYIKSDNEFIKNKELFDIEYSIKFNHTVDLFSTLYLRSKDDDYQSSTEYNYRIFTIGFGRIKKFWEGDLTFELFYGKRDSSEDIIDIMRPAIKFNKKFGDIETKYSFAYLRGESFIDHKLAITISIPISHKLSLDLDYDYERSEIDDSIDLDKDFSIKLKIEF